ncbi:hypothetical protein CPB86DRAFT_869648 [Serendipita vermifera]|nr:hypothetical protein CPB86DRAFT_869648 [Serendipita vermifera]
MLISPEKGKEEDTTLVLASSGEEHSSGEQHNVDLPTYSESVQGNSSTNQAATAGPSSRPKSNFVCLRFPHKGNIRNSWVIDTNLPIPESLLPPLQDGQTIRPNILLQTSFGSIETSITLVSESMKRANIHIETWDGHTVCKIYRTTKQPLKLKCVLRNAECAIGLPSDFVGPLRFRLKNSKVKLSNGMQSTTMILTSETAFVGDIQTSGFVDFDTWEGDEIELEKDGPWRKARLYYVSELEEREREEQAAEAAKAQMRRGFFGRLAMEKSSSH